MCCIKYHLQVLYRKKTVIDSLFYLAVKTGYTSNDHSLVKNWFKSSPLGINTISALLNGMVEIRNSSGRRLTNHSVKKSCVQALKDQNLPNTDIIAITGHKEI